MARLEDVCDKASSNIAQKDLEGNEGCHPIYGASGLIKNVDFYKQEKEYIAIVKDGAGVGRTMLLPAKSSVIGTMQYIIPKENVNTRFLCHVIEWMDLGRYCTGATIPHIYFKDYKNEKFNLPDLKEQRKIADRIEKVDELISCRKEQLSKLDELVKARFVEMFGDPFNNKKWDVQKLRNISVSIYDGSNVDKAYYEESGEVLFLRIQNVWFNEFRLEDSVYISKKVNSEYFDTSLHHGDLLITKIGRYYTKDSSLGRVSVYLGENDKANYSNNIMRVRLTDEVNSKFVNALMNLDDYNRYIREVSVGGTDKRALSKAIIGDLPIIMPPKELQSRFLEFAEQTEKTKAEVQKSLDELEILKKSLMQKYFG